MLVAGSMVDSQEAHKIGFVDALESGYETTVEHAVSWCQNLLSLPKHSMLGNRAIARSHFKQEFAGRSGQGIDGFVDAWFSDETQFVMNTLISQLKGKE